MATETTDTYLHGVAGDDGSDRLPRVSWAGIFAGVVAAMATQLSLSLLGLAIGFATVGGDETPAAGGFAIGSAAWLAVSLAISAFLGGLTAARSARYLSAGHGRLNGFLTGSLLSILMLFFTVNAVSGVARSALGLATGTLGTVANAAGAAARGAGGAVRDAGGLQSMFEQVGLGDEYQSFVSGLDRDELVTLIAERQPQLSREQVDTAAGVALSTLRNAGREVRANLSNPSDLPDVVRRQADAVQAALSDASFQRRLQARGLSQQEAAEVSQVLNQRVAQLRSETDAQLQAFQARADQIRRDAAEGASTAAWISLGIVGLILGLSTLGGAVGSGYKLGESVLREKGTARERFAGRTPVMP